MQRLLGRLVLASAAPLFLSLQAWAAHDDAYDFPYLDSDHAAIQYKAEPTNEPVARLRDRIDKGEIELQYDPSRGYLPSLLKLLGLSVDSQMLVFSKTSFQRQKIAPEKPRAIYFADNVALGFVQNSDVMELISIDPKQGPIFYTFEAPKGQKPTFTRRHDECLSCHLFPGTLNVPGLVVTSVFPGLDGSPREAAAGLVIDSRTPLMDRWGGWYVTGTSGELLHRGNALAPYPDQKDVLDYHGSQNLVSLDKKFDTRPYLAPTSDIVALMTLEHQTRATNLVTRLGWETRIAEQEGRRNESRLDLVAEQLVEYFLFVGEAKIHEPITGVSTFTQSFPKRGPHDKQGRSLRDFDLKRRLFRYPLSYMIYSEAFDNLPNSAKDRVYRRLYEVLIGKDQNENFSRLNSEDRRTVLEILKDTKPNLPAYWKF